MQKLVLLKEENEWNCIFTASKQFSAKHCTNCYIRFTFYCFFTMNFANFSLFWATKWVFLVQNLLHCASIWWLASFAIILKLFFIKLHLTTFDWSKNFTGQLTSLPSVKSKHSILLTSGDKGYEKLACDALWLQQCLWYPFVICILPVTAILVASAASKWPQWPQRSHLTSDLKSLTWTTLISICMLPLTAILLASEDMAASKQPQRSHLTSESNSVTSITYVAMLFWPLNASRR